MEFELLVGEQELSAVDIGFGEECNYIKFTLNGYTYTVEEDPDDGYRSYAKDMLVSDEKLNNSFEAIRVSCSMKENNMYETNDILVLKDVITGKIILEVGTDFSDDYYPCFISSWIPEGMCLNME